MTLPLLASSFMLSAVPFAQAAGKAPGDGTVTVHVVREVNANGLWDRVLEPGMAGVEVRLTDDAGQTITGTTGADGNVTLDPASSPLTGGKYRVQVMNPKPGVLFSAFASREGRLSTNTDSLSSTEEFVDVNGGNKAEVTTAFWNPADYCQKNADLVTACIGKDSTDGPEPDSRRTLVSFPYNARGNDNQTTNLATKGETGALYGIGYSKQKKWIFSGAMARRAAKYGPGGPGAIYLTDRANGDALSQFTTVPDVGSTDHAMATNMDLPFSPVVTKESLGDVEVSEDGKDLYVVNLNDKKLYRYDATQKTAAAPKASYDIPDPGCTSEDDWRPFGLGVQDGTVYVGGVCSAESTQDKADMRAVVQTFDPDAGSFTDVIMNEKLDYPRGQTDTIGGNCKGAAWYPWADGWRDQQDGRTCGARYAYPQPVLADIVVDTDGELILGFRDRHSDQTGYGLRNKPGGPTVDVSSGGDLNRACKDASGKFVLDGNGGCTNNGTSRNNGGQPADVLEYYPGEWRTPYHLESAFAGIALSKVENTIASSGIDVIDTTYNSGTMHVNRDGTKPPNGTQSGNQLTTTFGKGGSMADLEVLCDEAPIQIGNRVWYDIDKDGVQDPGEKPVPGATVNLYDKDGNLVATTKTTSRGEYYFDSIDDGLKFETQYTIKIDNPADYAEGGPLYNWTVTRNDAGTNDFIDSDGKVPAGGKFPEHTITTGTAGQDNHTYDFGYNLPEPDIDIEKKDEATDSDADTEAEKVILPDTLQKTLYMDITNNGKEPLIKVEVGDVVTKGGAKVTDLKCDWPDGTSSSDPTGTKVRWDNTFATPPDKPKSRFAVGATYKCTALLTGTKVEELHADMSRVDGEGEISGKHVEDEDPWHGEPIAGGVKVIKVDAKTKKPLAGAVFQLWRETNGTDGLQRDGDAPDTEVNQPVTTGTDGVAAAGSLEPGTYYWEETKAPEDYTAPRPPVFGPLVVNRDNATTGVSITAVNHKPDIDIEKTDQETGSDADTEGDKVVLPDTRDKTLVLNITNNGTEPLIKVAVGDVVTKGTAKVRDLRCNWPDGTSSFDPTGTRVRWDNTFATPPAKPKSRFAVGATYKCTARLTGLVATQIHGDRSVVDGEGEFSGKPVRDEDPWHGIPPKLKLLKKDAKTGKPLQGAVFQLWRESNGTPGLQRTGARADKKIGPACATNAAGACEYEAGLGSYYLQETAVPDGYLMPARTVFGPYKVTKNTKVLSVTLTNKPGEETKKKK
ncbi:SpaA isopeptide-forming pilin-related protein [Streptomyces sp. NPDC021093]|uniref:SpaA isopeptide-forming pilin-related protein n=1 Tax=Streptomyces sp. NPDC021093 TaxID=3365112 RepID=UPI0037A76E90